MALCLVIIWLGINTGVEDLFDSTKARGDGLRSIASRWSRKSGGVSILTLPSRYITAPCLSL
jgi:hypothetical protein